MPRYRVTDTITFERTWFITADSEDEACEIAGSGEVDPDTEEQVDNEPYSAEEIEGDDE